LPEERGSKREQPSAGDAVGDVPQDKLACHLHALRNIEFIIGKRIDTRMGVK